MLEELPLLVLGIGFYLREFRKDVSRDYYFIFTFLSFLCLPLSCFVSGAVASENSATGLSTMFYNFAFGFALVWGAIICLHLGFTLLESADKQNGGIDLNKKVQM